MTTDRIRIGGLSVPISTSVTSPGRLPAGIGTVMVIHTSRPLPVVCPWGRPRCGELAEPGEGNPDGYCTQHLDDLAGEQEDWECSSEYARRRRMLCPYQMGPGLPEGEWCPEPSDPDSDEGWCVVHNPDYNPVDPRYDPEAASGAVLSELVPCLQCRGGYRGCGICGGTGRISLGTANWHRLRSVSWQRGDGGHAGVGGAVTTLPGSTVTAGTPEEPSPDPAPAQSLVRRLAGQLRRPWAVKPQRRPGREDVPAATGEGPQLVAGPLGRVRRRLHRLDRPI